jgi:hypothetical protein
MKKNILIAASLCVAASVHAGLATYPDQGSWNSAVTGIVNTQIPDPGSDDFFLLGTGDASVTYNNVNFSVSSALGNGIFFNVGVGFSGTPAVLSDQQGTSGEDNILITFPSPVDAFSLNYGTFNASSVSFVLGNGDSFAQGSTGSGYSVPDFAGASDTTFFSSVLITAPISDVLNINNVSYAGAVSSNVPELSTYGLDVFLALPFCLQALRFSRGRKIMAA